MILPTTVGGAVYFAPQEAQKVSALFQHVCNVVGIIDKDFILMK